MPAVCSLLRRLQVDSLGQFMRATYNLPPPHIYLPPDPAKMKGVRMATWFAFKKMFDNEFAIHS